MSTQIARMATPETVRMFSTEGSRAASKLHTVFEEYRKEHYTQEVPSRFKKDILRAADLNRDGYISAHAIESVLRNIGADGRITKEEIDTIFMEAGEKRSENASEIPVDKMMLLI
eukprot:CAMPEP_0185733724 /NCGR_PEP_ID=MMETSP1171-20130828/20377_1 /TAXON_ID=374046 /ORGANISM="Helicotheca tamensis, Strain CCMP826" /LENGTH=114 /DNA_ID=CAMNT_0028403523 /DNA_START=143 /DNA_END=487 /DNA_ORIENTATION=+